MMYCMKGQIRFSECDERQILTIPSLVNYFQDCSSQQSELLGVGKSYLEKKRRAWILSSWQIEVRRLPAMAEEIEVYTWASGFQGFFGPRNFQLKSKDGEELARANSVWVYMNLDTGRPVKPEEEELAMYPLGEPLELWDNQRKIRVSKEAEVVDSFQVRKYHMDTNHHMNNSQYVRLALETVSDEEEIQRIRVEYKKAAVYGDTMIAKKAIEEERTVVMLCDESDTLYATVELIGDKNI